MTDLPVEEMTRNPVDESYGYVCREHGLHRSGLTQLHATNLQAKHLREQHAASDLRELDLEAGALAYVSQQGGDHRAMRGAREVWEALTGLAGDDAWAYAESLLDTGARAAVVPF